MSDILRGGPLSQSTYQQFQAPPSFLSQVGGLGLAAYGLSRPGVMKEGGLAKESSAPAGLSELLLYDMGKA